MRISVNCPSFKRPKVETLDYLSYCKVWVDESEYDEYIKNNPAHKKNIISVPKGIQGNLCRIRNYILDKELESNDAVLLIDDDLSCIERFEPNGTYGYEKHKLDEDELMEMLEHYTNLCQEFGFLFWGVNCNGDALSYRQTTPFSTTSYIGGPFQCHLRGSEIRYDERLPLKEDYDITLQHMNKYRGALRINKYHYDCKQSKQSGGCATYRNFDREMEQLELLQKKWGKAIVKIDSVNNANMKKQRKTIDYNPIIKVPILGV